MQSWLCKLKNGDYNIDGKETPWTVTAFLGSEPVVGLVWALVCLVLVCTPLPSEDEVGLG